MRAHWMLVVAIAACGGDPGDGPDTDEIDAEGKADGEIRVRVDGMTVWIDPLVVRGDGPRAWRLGGRASRNLDAVHSFVPDDAFGETTIQSARTFEIALDDHELNSIVSGLPLFVQITPATGAAATAAVWLAPRLGDFSGTSKLRLDTTVTPRWVGGDVMYRGGGRSDPNWFLTASGPNAPQVFAAAEANRWRLDWTYTAFAANEPFAFHVHNAALTGAKQARARFITRRLGLTRLDPYDVWQQRCESHVRACVEALPAGTVDAGACGTYRQVLACGGIDVGAQPVADRVAADLRTFLVEFYAGNPDIPDNGGNTLAAAQAAVDPNSVELVTVPEEDPYGWDLGTHWVFRHPDVTFPGSDIVWYVVYAKATGALIQVYEFN